MLFKHDDAAACNQGTDHGQCDKTTGKCICGDLYTGKDCAQFKSCPGGTSCNGHGICDLSTGKCTCSVDFNGKACKHRKCPSASENGRVSKLAASEPMVCSGHGMCKDTGACECFHGFAGTYCQMKRCPDDCSNHGACNSQSGICACKEGYTGHSCRYSACPEDCNGYTNGNCDRDSGICRCNKDDSIVFSGPTCATSTTCHIVETQYRDWAFFKPGWSKCPDGSLLQGLKTAEAAPCTSIDCIDKAKCSKACVGKTELSIHHCYQANWWKQLDGPGWAKCRDPYFVAGFWRNKCNSLYCLEMALCCSLNGASWSHCGKVSWKNDLDKSNRLAQLPPNRLLTGIYRKGASSELSDMHEASYCGFKLDSQLE